jgi:tRNA U34 5-methylaminomethyl-2-thiouridine-forming methyltransferase MnmC
MEPALVATADGSFTVSDPRTGEHYHSLHGAESESRHVFIEAGLHLALQTFEGALQVLEVGFGTGLNALLTWQEAAAQQRAVAYLGYEPYPLPAALLRAFHTPALLPDEGPAWRRAFLSLHGLEPEPAPPVEHPPSPEPKKKPERGKGPLPGPDFFSCTVQVDAIQSAALPDHFHLVYFDAFSPDREPGLWTANIWQKLFVRLAPGGILVTYCAKGSVRRALVEAGFQVERLPGPAFKRHMLRAVKPRHNPIGSDPAK